MKILGTCVGVELVRRGNKDEHVCIQFLTEDDDTWHKSDFSISSFWIDDLLTVINSTKNMLDSLPDDPSGYGKVFTLWTGKPISKELELRQRWDKEVSILNLRFAKELAKIKAKQKREK